MSHVKRTDKKEISISFVKIFFFLLMQVLPLIILQTHYIENRCLQNRLNYKKHF